MISYSGIGTRETTPKEEERILKISEKLSKSFVLYSGNASGSDRKFQEGCNGNCVLFLPWASFDSDKYDFTKALDVFDLGKSPEGMASVEKFHPNGKNMKYTHKLLMSRNYHQIMGYKQYPRVSFVVCCASEDDEGNVLGGTGQAVRIAKNIGIPVINIRVPGWSDYLSHTIKSVIKELRHDIT